MRVLPELGHERLREITLPQLQRFVDRLAGEGVAAATITTAITPLRAIYRRARQLGGGAHQPDVGDLDARRSTGGRAVRHRRAARGDARASSTARRIAPMWATALYAGLRRGELMALHREDVDLATGVIRVERGWDQSEGEIAPKSKQGRRKVPIPAVLRDRLVEYLMRRAGRGPDLRRGPRQLRPRPRRRRGRRVEPPTLHECRHGYASLMIAAGVNVKALSTFMGHANIRITLDQYGHLLPGAEDEAAGLLDAFLARQLGGAEVEPRESTVAV